MNTDEADKFMSDPLDQTQPKRPNTVRRRILENVNEFFGVEEPSAKYRWGVVIPIPPVSLLTRGTGKDSWQAVRWFATRKRAERYAMDRFSDYAIARRR